MEVCFDDQVAERLRALPADAVTSLTLRAGMRPCAQDVCMDAARTLSALHNLRSLRLQGCHVDTVGAAAVLEAVAEAPIHTLDLSSNLLQATSTGWIERLAGLSRLTSLDLSFNDLSDGPGFVQLCDTITAHLTGLVTLRMQGCGLQMLSPRLATLPRLTQLLVSGNLLQLPPPCVDEGWMALPFLRGVVKEGMETWRAALVPVLDNADLALLLQTKLAAEQQGNNSMHVFPWYSSDTLPRLASCSGMVYVFSVDEFVFRFDWTLFPTGAIVVVVDHAGSSQPFHHASEEKMQAALDAQCGRGCTLHVKAVQVRDNDVKRLVAIVAAAADKVVLRWQFPTSLCNTAAVVTAGFAAAAATSRPAKAWWRWQQFTQLYYPGVDEHTALHNAALLQSMGAVVLLPDSVDPQVVASPGWLYHVVWACLFADGGAALPDCPAQQLLEHDHLLEHQFMVDVLQARAPVEDRPHSSLLAACVVPALVERGLLSQPARVRTHQLRGVAAPDWERRVVSRDVSVVLPRVSAKLLLRSYEHSHLDVVDWCVRYPVRRCVRRRIELPPSVAAVPHHVMAALATQVLLMQGCTFELGVGYVKVASLEDDEVLHVLLREEPLPRPLSLASGLPVGFDVDVSAMPRLLCVDMLAWYPGSTTATAAGAQRPMRFTLAAQLFPWLTTYVCNAHDLEGAVEVVPLVWKNDRVLDSGSGGGIMVATTRYVPSWWVSNFDDEDDDAMGAAATATSVQLPPQSPSSRRAVAGSIGSVAVSLLASACSSHSSCSRVVLQPMTSVVLAAQYPFLGMQPWMGSSGITLPRAALSRLLGPWETSGATRVEDVPEAAFGTAAAAPRTGQRNEYDDDEDVPDSDSEESEEDGHHHADAQRRLPWSWRIDWLDLCQPGTPFDVDVANRYVAGKALPSDPLPLGCGGYGAVWAGKWRPRWAQAQPLVDVAVKVSTGRGANRVRMSEVRLMWELRHPNVVQLHGVALQPAGIVMEVVRAQTGEAVTLRDWVKDDVYPTRRLHELADIAFQMCAGMEHVHAHGVIHRDLKPSNMLLGQTADGQWVAKISDFGVSVRMRDGVHRSMSGAGTRGYTAPEQALPRMLNPGHDYEQRQHYCVTEKADVWSFGIVLQRLFTGIDNAAHSLLCVETAAKALRRADKKQDCTFDTQPLANQFAASMRNALQTELRRGARQLDAAVAPLIDWCLYEDPAERPSFTQLKQAFEQLRRSLPCDTRQPATPDWTQCTPAPVPVIPHAEACAVWTACAVLGTLKWIPARDAVCVPVDTVAAAVRHVLVTSGTCSDAKQLATLCSASLCGSVFDKDEDGYVAAVDMAAVFYPYEDKTLYEVLQLLQEDDAPRVLGNSWAAALWCACTCGAGVERVRGTACVDSVPTAVLLAVWRQRLVDVHALSSEQAQVMLPEEVGLLVDVEGDGQVDAADLARVTACTANGLEAATVLRDALTAPVFAVPPLPNDFLGSDELVKRAVEAVTAQVQHEHACTDAAALQATRRVFVLSGRLGSGKTRMLLQVATALAAAGQPTPLFGGGVVYATVHGVGEHRVSSAAVHTALCTAVGMATTSTDSRLGVEWNNWCARATRNGPLLLAVDAGQARVDEVVLHLRECLRANETALPAKPCEPLRKPRVFLVVIGHATTLPVLSMADLKPVDLCGDLHGMTVDSCVALLHTTGCVQHDDVPAAAAVARQALCVPSTALLIAAQPQLQVGTCDAAALMYTTLKALDAVCQQVAAQLAVVQCALTEDALAAMLPHVGAERLAGVLEQLRRVCVVEDVLVSSHQRAGPRQWALRHFARSVMMMQLGPERLAIATVRFAGYCNQHVARAAALHAAGRTTAARAVLHHERVALLEWLRLATTADAQPVRVQAAFWDPLVSSPRLNSISEVLWCVDGTQQLLKFWYACARYMHVHHRDDGHALPTTASYGAVLVHIALVLMHAEHVYDAIDTARKGVQLLHGHYGHEHPLVLQAERVLARCLAEASSDKGTLTRQQADGVLRQQYECLRARAAALLHGRGLAADCVQALLDQGLLLPVHEFVAETVARERAGVTNAEACVLLRFVPAVASLLSHASAAAAATIASAADGGGGGGLWNDEAARVREYRARTADRCAAATATASAPLAPVDEAALWLLHVQMVHLVVLGGGHALHSGTRWGDVVHCVTWMRTRRQLLRCLEVDSVSAAQRVETVAITLANLASNLSDTGTPHMRTLALEVYLEVAAMRKRVLGVHSADVARTQSYIAIVLHQLQRYSEACAHFEECMHTRVLRFGYTHVDVAATLNNLAIVKNKMNNAQGAVELYEQVVVIRERQLGKVHPEVVAALDNLAVVLFKTQDKPRAVKTLERCLKLKQRLSSKTGGSASEVARIKFKLGVMTFAADHAKGMDWFVAAVQLQKQAPGRAEVFDMLLDVATIIHLQAGVALSGMPARQRWLDVCLGALDGRRGVPACPYGLSVEEMDVVASSSEQVVLAVAKVLHSMGLVLFADSQFEHAVCVHLQCLALRERVVAWNHKEVVIAHYNLGNAYSRLGKCAEALSEFEKALAGAESPLPDASVSPTAFAAYTYLHRTSALRGVASASEDMKDYERSLSAYSKCLALYTSSAGDNAESVVGVLDSMAACSFNLHKYTEAASLYRQAVEAHQQHCDKLQAQQPSQPPAAVITVQQQLAALLYKLAYVYASAPPPVRDYTAALQCFEQCLRLQLAHGVSALEVGITHVSLGDVHYQLGQVEQSNSCFAAARAVGHADVARAVDEHATRVAGSIVGVPWNKTMFRF